MKTPILYMACLLTAMINLGLTPNSFSQTQPPTLLGTESLGPQGSPIPLTDLGKSAIGIRLESVERRPLPMSIETTGKIEAIPTMQFQQHALVSGRIINTLVKEGDYVRGKQALLLLDSPEINQLAADTLKTRTELEAQIAETQATLNADVKQYQTQLDLAQASFQRVEKLFSEGIASQKSLQEATAEIKLAESRLKASREKGEIIIRALKTKLNIVSDSLRHRLMQLGVSEAGIERMFKSQRTILTVPVLANRQGIVAQVSATIGQSIDPASELFKISDLSYVWATADIYEDDMARIRLGEKVDLKVAAFPYETFSGKLTYIGTEVDPQKRTLPVRAEVANADLRLKPDMYAQLFVQTSEPSLTMMLPKEAVLESTGHNLVFVETTKGYQAIRVKTGRSLGDKIEILAGLSAGQKVVVEGAYQLNAELLRAHGKEDLFSQPTEGERFIGHDDEPESANDSPAWHLLLAAIIGVLAFCFGLLVSALSKQSTKEKQRSQTHSDSEKVAKG